MCEDYTYMYGLQGHEDDDAHEIEDAAEAAMEAPTGYEPDDFSDRQDILDITKGLL